MMGRARPGERDGAAATISIAGYSRVSVTPSPSNVQRTYLVLTLLQTFAASFIWGINTLFLLDAGLSNTEAFAANAFFAAGQVLFEVPTGVVADTRGRRFSYLLGAATLLASTVLYLVMWQIHAPFIGWAVSSILLGLGFTFFSGATEAWLVDALGATGYTGTLETVLGRAQTVGGAAMLVGSVSGGVIAQLTDLGVPYLLRAVFLGATFVVAARFMHDIGFTPRHGANAVDEVRSVVRGSIDGGWRNPPVRALMLAAPFTSGAAFFAFYASQPYLLQLFGDPSAYGVAGLTAAIFAGAQILGGILVPHARRLFRRRTDALIIGTVLNVAILGVIGWTGNFADRTGAARGLGDGLRNRNPTPPGLHQRLHRLGAARDRALVRLADGVDRWRHRPACARQGGRRVRLRPVVPGDRGGPGHRDPVCVHRPADERRLGSDPGQRAPRGGFGRTGRLTRPSPRSGEVVGDTGFEPVTPRM